MLKVKPDQYIFPPRSKNAVPREQSSIFGALGWKAQLKYNDTRTIIKYCHDDKIELWTRHAEKFRSYNPPAWLVEELAQIGSMLNRTPGTVMMLDGGLLDQKHRLIKDTIVIWDMLVFDDEHLLGTTYASRYGRIAGLTSGPWCYNVPKVGNVEFGLRLTDHVLVPECHSSESWTTLWTKVDQVNKPFDSPVLEGLCFKDMNGKLELGHREINNSSWFMRSRVKTGRHNF